MVIVRWTENPKAGVRYPVFPLKFKTYNMVVTLPLNDYLKERWRVNNHKKYQKYFDEWVRNLTQDQILNFKREMDHIKNNWLCS